MRSKTERTLIAEGADSLGAWYHGLEPIDSSLTTYINDSLEHDLNVDWAKIIRKVFRGANVSKTFRPDNTLDVYAFVPDMQISFKNWKGEGPGLSSTGITVHAPAKRISHIKLKLNLLLGELERCWRANQFDLMIATKELEAASIKLETQSKAQLKLQLEQLARERALNAQRQFMDWSRELVRFFIDSTPEYFSTGPVLITKEKNAFVITNHDQFDWGLTTTEVLDFVKAVGLEVIEVMEFNIDGTPLRHVPIFQRPMLKSIRGWGQDGTMLVSKTGDSSLPDEMRIRYLSWLKTNR